MMAFYRILATGSGFSGYVETTGCSRGTMQRLFRDFALWVETHYHDSVLCWPRTEEDLEFVERPFKELRFPECCGSMDGVGAHCI